MYIRCVYLIPSYLSWALTEKRCEETNKLGKISKTMSQNEVESSEKNYNEGGI